MTDPETPQKAPQESPQESLQVPPHVRAFAGEFPPAEMAQWRALIDKALKGADFDRRLVARTADGIRIEPVYAHRPTATIPGAAAVDASGTRGLDGAAWDIRQIHVHEDPAAANEAILSDLAGGATSIQLQIAAPGWVGLAPRTDELARALDGVLLDVCPLALKAGENTPGAAGALMALWHDRGIPEAHRRGAIQYDPLGTLAETGALLHPVPRALAIAADLIKQVAGSPGVTALRADGHVWHAAGASEAQELAAVLATVVAYLRAAETAGISPTAALPKIAVTLAVDADQLMGLAKLRAARIVLARVAEACGAAGAAEAVTVAAETSRTMMSRRDPWVNMLRTTMACATAAMAGADSIAVLPFTVALGAPDAFARRMARNTSIVVMEESALGRVADPAAGSFAIETLTAEVARSAWALFQRIEAAGGLAAALADGRIQADIAATASARARAVATGKVALTGTSAFPRLGDDGVTVTPWPPLPTATAELNGARVKPLAEFRPSAPFERLRDAADAFAVRAGHPPRVFLCCMGPLASHAARATWMSNFLAAGGIEAASSPPVLQSADAGRAFVESDAAVACLCGTDETYAEMGEAMASLIKTAGANHLVLAGRPKELEAGLSAAGVDGFVYAGCDMIATLTALQTALGVAPPAAG